jgi:thiamine transport system permease protein
MKKEVEFNAEKGEARRKRLLSKFRIIETLDKFSSRKAVKYGIYLTAVIVFSALILLPPILGIIIKWNAMQEVLSQPKLVSQAFSVIGNSFIIALLVSTLDVITGVPMAWLISRGKSKWLNVLDTLSDIPFIVPTAALGYSLLLFWNGSEEVSSFFGSSLVSPGWLLVLLLHFTFSYPVVVRVVVGALLDYKMEYEQASRTLGAPPFTAARTVTLSVLKPSLIAAFILAFSRSISETGATIIVAGAFENGAIFIQNQLGPTKQITGSVVFASFVLISLSILIFIIIRLLGPRLKMPVRKVWPKTERRVSYSTATTSRNTISLIIFAIFVLIPSLFVALSAISAVFGNTFIDALNRVGIWKDYWQSLLLSYSLGAIVTLLNIVIGLPMAILIARKKLGATVSGILDIMVNIPLIVTSAALGASLKIFWTQGFPSIPETWLLIFAHLSITYPYFVRSMSAAVERISVDLEEASRTLGAKSLGVFRTIILPLTKYSIISGAILVFTRSISETGATLAVSNLQTAPVIIVTWVKQQLPVHVTPLEIGLGCGFLILFSFIILLALRLVVRGRGRY